MIVRNYMKKPIIIEAMVFENTVECLYKLSEFMYGQGKEAKINYCDKESPKLIIDTLEGTMYASEGDYIIKGISGEFYPCKPDIFHKTYVEV